jgi:hypothetical protein
MIKNIITAVVPGLVYFFGVGICVFASFSIFPFIFPGISTGIFLILGVLAGTQILTSQYLLLAILCGLLTEILLGFSWGSHSFLYLLYCGALAFFVRRVAWSGVLSTGIFIVLFSSLTTAAYSRGAAFIKDAHAFQDLTWIVIVSLFIYIPIRRLVVLWLKFVDGSNQIVQ